MKTRTRIPITALILMLALASGSCRRSAPKSTLQIRDESGATLATFSDVNVVAGAPGMWHLKVAKKDEAALATLTRANTGKRLDFEVAGKVRSKATLNAPIVNGEATLSDGTAPEATAGDPLKPVEAGK